MDKTDRRIVIGALLWSLGILTLSYSYRFIVTDPWFSPLEPVARTEQVQLLSQLLE